VIQSNNDKIIDMKKIVAIVGFFFCWHGKMHGMDSFPPGSPALSLCHAVLAQHHLNQSTVNTSTQNAQQTPSHVPTPVAPIQNQPLRVVCAGLGGCVAFRGKQAKL
jgi:hypothetical protein